MRLAITQSPVFARRSCLRLSQRLRRVLVQVSGQHVKHNLLQRNTKKPEEVIVIEYAGHLGDCAVREDGPCTCGTDEVLEELALEEAGLAAEDFE